MSFLLVNLLYAFGLLLGMLILLEAGRQIALRRMAVDSEGGRTGIGTVEGALLALLGLLIAFSFSGAASRYDQRRQQIVDEARDIGGAYALVDLLSNEAQPLMRDTFRQYVGSRLEAYRMMPDLAATRAELNHSKSLQNDIWRQAVAATRDSEYRQVEFLILPAIGKMANISTKRTAALYTHPPAIIFVMLVGLMLVGSLLAGYGMASNRSRNWTHTVAFALTLALTFYVIRDLEYPRLPGLVGMDNVDNVLVELRDSMR